MATPPATPFNLEYHAETKLPQIGKSDAFVNIVKALSMWVIKEVLCTDNY